jgi:hypothetical protein
VTAALWWLVDATWPPRDVLERVYVALAVLGPALVFIWFAVTIVRIRAERPRPARPTGVARRADPGDVDVQGEGGEIDLGHVDDQPTGR